MPEDVIQTVIRTPHRRSDGGAVTVRQRFLATGTLTGEFARTVSVTLADKAGANMAGRFSYQILPVRGLSVDGPGGARALLFTYGWSVMFDLTDPDGKSLPPGEYRLTVDPLPTAGHDDAKPVGDAISIVVGREIVTISYPPNNHTIEGDELDFFYTTGGSQIPVTSATLGGLEANYLTWVPELEYWVAEFLFLGNNPGTGTYFLVVSDADGPAQRRVKIA